ncbi:MAG: type II toxin-antitoxin system RelE/ParE family toxin [Hyphomicrobiales bacterium]|nr:type II toxin-antitoxin system RelE/ParE family toxin [Hyphomicrobiales bacterium]
MKVSYTDLAFAELEAIYDDLNRVNPQAADRFADRLFQIEDQIRMFPSAFQHLPNRPRIHRAAFVRFPYLLFYILKKDEAVVVRIIHGARDKPWENL